MPIINPKLIKYRQLKYWAVKSEGMLTALICISTNI